MDTEAKPNTGVEQDIGEPQNVLGPKRVTPYLLTFCAWTDTGAKQNTGAVQDRTGQDRTGQNSTGHRRVTDVLGPKRVTPYYSPSVCLD